MTLSALKVLRALLERRRSSDGWCSFEQLRQESETSRAMIYRYVDALEYAGFPIERERGNWAKGSGRVRCAFMLVPRKD